MILNIFRIKNEFLYIFGKFQSLSYGHACTAMLSGSWKIFSQAISRVTSSRGNIHINSRVKPTKLKKTSAIILPSDEFLLNDDSNEDPLFIDSKPLSDVRIDLDFCDVSIGRKASTETVDDAEGSTLITSTEEIEMARLTASGLETSNRSTGFEHEYNTDVTTNLISEEGSEENNLDVSNVYSMKELFLSCGKFMRIGAPGYAYSHIINLHY